MLSRNQIKKIVEAGYEHGSIFRRENTDIDCSHANNSGGWTDALLAQANSNELASAFGVDLNEDGEWSDDDWDRFLMVYEEAAQRGWEDAVEYSE